VRVLNAELAVLDLPRVRTDLHPVRAEVGAIAGILASLLEPPSS